MVRRATVQRNRTIDVLTGDELVEVRGGIIYALVVATKAPRPSLLFHQPFLSIFGSHWCLWLPFNCSLDNKDSSGARDYRLMGYD